MHKLVPVLVVLAVALLLPATATAKPMSPQQLTDAVLLLQRQVKTLQAQVAAQGATISELLRRQRELHALLSGPGAPAPTLGRMGDFYLDTSALRLYGPKATSGWGAGVELKGPQGDPGAQGDPGPKGDPGQQAEQGATGTAGAPGPDPAENPAYAGLFAMTDYVSVSTEATRGVAGPHVIFQGVNVHVRSSQEEEDATGLGNLIVGWNEPVVTEDGPVIPQRSGTNCLVVGSGNSFAGAGHFVAGLNNFVDSLYASVSGGSWNRATGPCASVTGGDNNRAAGEGSSVTGGNHNGAFGAWASVTGGSGNGAAGTAASVSGGYGNLAQGGMASVSGGGENQAMALRSSISGGHLFLVNTDYGWRVGDFIWIQPAP